eukprot:m.200697 g.200697  ORF g.200697 m.200697 type:complete len:471 (+) comp53819_c0_seq2:185-1597(+)
MLHCTPRHFSPTCIFDAQSAHPCVPLMPLQEMKAVLAVLCLVLACAAQDPSFDHQTVTYDAKYPEYTLSATSEMTVMPYFSPDHSIEVQTAEIQSATISIDIANPEFQAWTSCDYPSTCNGCSPNTTRYDAFPGFAALLNAVHAGITVRILVNDYGVADCEGAISPLSFLFMNGAQVRYYTSTTFLHAKYMVIDGKSLDISSVNWSNQGFMQNREAGVVIKNGDISDVVAYTSQIFNADWAQAYNLTITQTYNAEDKAIILDTSAVPVVMPPPFSAPGAYITPKPTEITLSAKTPARVSTSPDYSRTQLFEDIDNATVSFSMMIYQVTDTELCDSIYSMWEKLNKNVSIGVSYRIDAEFDCEAANECYKTLTEKGMTIHKTPTYYQYSHNKFWIIDGVRVGWSTGNWSPEDYPDATVFPIYGKSGWLDTNRDYSASFTNPAMVSVFETVLSNDLAKGKTWTTDYPVLCGG